MSNKEMKKVVVIIAMGVFLSVGFLSEFLYAHDGGHGRFHGGGPFYNGGGSRVFIGGSFGFPYYYPYWSYPHYYTYYYPRGYRSSYPEPYIHNEPPVNIEPQQTYYWYYCRDPKGYYPYIENCPGEWTRVVPTPPPPGKEGAVK
jgi:hypothetical protein